MAKKNLSKTEIVPKGQKAMVNSATMSVYDIAMAIELGKLDPGHVEKDTQIDCVFVYRARRYPIAQIAALLKVDVRTVSRYVAEGRKKNAIKASSDFQAEFIGDSLNNLWAQYARLIRWSYSDELSEADKIRASLSACQIQKYAIELMERLGYLSPKNTEVEIKKELASQFGEDGAEGWEQDMDLLTRDQLALAASAKLQKQQELNEFMEGLVKALVKENKLKLFEFTAEDINPDALKKALCKKHNYLCQLISE